MKTTRSKLPGLAALLLAMPAAALEPGQRVDDFRLLDHRGDSRALYYHADAPAVVIMVQGNGCPVVRQALPALAELRGRFGPRGVEFLLLNAQDDREAVAREAAEFGIDLPVLLDPVQLVASSMGVTRTAEVFVVDPRTRTLAYRGPVDNRLAYGAQKPAATRHYLADALEALLAGRQPAITQVEPVGCLVDMQKPAPASYAREVAPLLAEKCSGCHRPGGIGPWAMTGYERVRGFAPMIREVLRTGRMPPWHADPHFWSFEGDRSLTDAQRALLVRWVEAGAPRGDGPDPLLAVTPVTQDWALGKPDLVVEVPAFDVPATGVVDYRYPRAANPLDRDVWVRAIEIHPGDRSVVHHVLAGIDDPQTRGRDFVEQLAALGGYSPGRNPLPYPDGAGVLLRKGAGLRFQMHYTPTGKAVRDVTRIGLYFHDGPPAHELRLKFLRTHDLRIPPHAADHAVTVSHVFERDIVLYSLMPHAHLRGKAARFTATFPDGREEVLLSVPNYDFAWQSVYQLREPRVLPAGTRVDFLMRWDNSARNPANPDPARSVPWGDQTWDEMNAGWIRYRELAPGESARAAN
jgi:mono/diheme cytochrome c family protein/peroxiredoxin